MTDNYRSIWLDMEGDGFDLSYVDVAGYRTRVLVAGEGDPLILMHGTGGHLEAYARNIAELSRVFRVIAYDFPGHGRTSLAINDLELPVYVDHLLALCERFGVNRAHLMGESLGGWVAVKFAFCHPDMVRRMVLNTPGGTMASPEVMERIRSLSQAAADEPTGARVRARLEWLMADPSSVTEELVAVRRSIYSRQGFSESMRHILCLQRSEVRARNMTSDKELRAIAAPTLVVWTSADPSGPSSEGAHLASELPAGSFVLIDRAGHWPQWEQANTYNRVVTEFLTADAP